MKTCGTCAHYHPTRPTYRNGRDETVGRCMRWWPTRDPIGLTTAGDYPPIERCHEERCRAP